jgi:pilus assembly protein Flp/PilA
MNKIVQYVKQFLNDDEGVTAIEYGLIASLIGVVIIAATTSVGTALVTIFGRVATAL